MESNGGVRDMTNIHDAIKYGWVDQLAKDFYYEKCHGHPEDIVQEIHKLITGVVEAQETRRTEQEILDSIPF